MNKSFLLIPVLFAVTSCSTTIPVYEFPNQTARQCFVPCESQYDSCKTTCGAASVRGGSENILYSLVYLDCINGCNNAVDKCATGCGGHEYSESAHQNPPMSEAHHRKLRIKMLKMEGTYKKILRSCTRLYEEVNQLARAKHGLPREECPPKGVFVNLCLELKPETARCLIPSVARREQDACKAPIQKEALRPVKRINHALSLCYPLKETPAPPTSQPAQPSPSPEKQMQDQEAP